VTSVSQTEEVERIEANGASRNVRSNVDAKKGGAGYPQCGVRRTRREVIRHGICVLHHTQRELTSSNHDTDAREATQDNIYLLAAHVKDTHRYDTHLTRCR
jgi:hypothetical protein